MSGWIPIEEQLPEDSHDVLDRIKIGGIFYEVQDIPDLAEGQQRLDGHIEYGPGRINLNANLGTGTRAVVLWHEILHAILTHAGQKQLTESVMDALAYGIVQIIADNESLGSPRIICRDGYEFCPTCGTALGVEDET